MQKSRGRSELGRHQALGKWTYTLLLPLLGGVWESGLRASDAFGRAVVVARRQMQPLRIVALPLLLIRAALAALQDPEHL